MIVEIFQYDKLPERFKKSFIKNSREELRKEYKDLGLGEPMVWQYNEHIDRCIRDTWFSNEHGDYLKVTFNKMFI